MRYGFWRASDEVFVALDDQGHIPTCFIPILHGTAPYATASWNTLLCSFSKYAGQAMTDKTRFRIPEADRGLVMGFEEAVRSLRKDFRTEFERTTIRRDVSIGGLLVAYRMDSETARRLRDAGTQERLDKLMSELRRFLLSRPADVSTRIENELAFFVEKLARGLEWLPEEEPEEFTDKLGTRSIVEELLKEAKSHWIDTRSLEARVAQFDTVLRQHARSLFDNTMWPPEETAHYPAEYWWWHLGDLAISNGS